MILNDENKLWAIDKLARFSGWRCYPQNSDDVDARARSFLRLVHNKPVRQIIQESCAKRGAPMPEIDWEAKGMDPEQYDADWILDFIAETMDYFPLPVQMRQIYTDKLPPASTFGEAPARED